MTLAVLLCASLLSAAPPASVPEAEAEGPSVSRAEGDRAGAIAEYNARATRARETAESQWRLALWCEENGLEAEAVAHLSAVVRLDPKREAAWRKLGYSRHGKRWLSDAQAAEEEARTRAFRAWVPRLARLHAQVHGGKKQAEAARALAAIDEPEAVPAVYAVLGKNGPIDQAIAVQILGQIPGKESTKVLAVLSVYGASADVRRLATETLRQREPDDYLATLVGLLVDPLTFEIRPVGGPGSPGILLVEGEKFNVRRFYAPPPPPSIAIQPGDMVTYDDLGLPVITRMTDRTMVKPSLIKTPYEVDGVTGFRVDTGLDFVEAMNGAFVAQAQLANDVATLRATNAARKAFSDHILDVIKAASGEDAGKTPAACKAWFADRNGYVSDPPKVARRKAKATVDQLVPLAYQPEFGHFQAVGYLSKFLAPPDT